MSRRVRMVLVAVAVGAAAILAGGLGWWVGSDRISDERAGRIERADQARNFLLQVRDQRTRRPELDERLQWYVDRTLGGELDEADSALRTRLNRLGERERLKGLTVSTAGTTARESPAKARFSRSSVQRPFRDEIDFVELQGVISGEGTLEQALRLVSRLEAEPWLKRLDEVRLDGRKKGSRVRVTVRLTTLYLPGREPVSPPDSTWTAERFAGGKALAAANPFALPAPPAPAPAPPPTAVATEPEPPARDEYGEWRMTGIVEAPGGAEVWLHNPASGETRVLRSGDRIHDLVLLAAAGEDAEFAMGEERYRLSMGGRLSEREPISR